MAEPLDLTTDHVEADIITVGQTDASHRDLAGKPVSATVTASVSSGSDSQPTLHPRKTARKSDRPPCKEEPAV